MPAIRNLAETFVKRLGERIELGLVFGGSVPPSPAPEPSTDESETP